MSALDDFINLLIPRRCHLCGKLLIEGDEYICSPCLHALPRTLYHKIENNPVELLFAGIIPFERATAHFFYTPQSSMAEIVQDFKYRGFPGLARFLGKVIGRELQNVGFFNGIDCILPIPLHWYKQMKRGYNQSRMLAEGIGEITGIDVNRNLYARRHHSTQTRLSHNQRDINVRDAFGIKDPESLGGKHILLIDDVCTTGATLREAALTIHRESPQSRLSLLSLCIATV